MDWLTIKICSYQLTPRLVATRDKFCYIEDAHCVDISIHFRIAWAIPHTSGHYNVATSSSAIVVIPAFHLVPTLNDHEVRGLVSRGLLWTRGLVGLLCF